jgi:exopolysaccharide biosynthesis polyprenyl glycosylphosphotransferase
MEGRRQSSHYERFRLKNSEQRFILILGDILAGVIALFLALYIWAEFDLLDFTAAFFRDRVDTWFYFLPLIWVVLLIDTYDLGKAGKFKSTLKGVIIALIVAAAAYLVVYFLVPPMSLPRVGVASFIIFAAILTLIWRLIFIRMFKAASQQRRVLIVGAGKAGTELIREIEKTDPKPFNLIGLIDDDPLKLNTKVLGVPVLGDHKMLEPITEQMGVSDFILAITHEMNPGMLHTILDAQEAGIGLTTMQDAYEAITGRVPIDLLQPDWVVRAFLDRKPNSGFYRIFKRLLDLFLAMIGLVGLLIVFPFIALGLVIEGNVPIIFKQERLGRGGVPYIIYKFSTMRKHSEDENNALVTAEKDPRITKFGRLLRKTHLDELPQIINVLKGEMSFVGPRPERSELVQVFQNGVPFYRTRLLVKPGITGWAQIHQGYAETVEETAIKLEYDLYYISHASLWMDITILLRTFGSVLGLKGR